MGKPPSPLARRGRPKWGAFLCLLASAAVLTVGLVGVAAFALYEVGKALAAQALGTVLVGVAETAALYGTLLMTLAVFLLAAMVVMMLETPPLLAPFGPLAEVLRFGLRVWAGHG